MRRAVHAAVAEARLRRTEHQVQRILLRALAGQEARALARLNSAVTAAAMPPDVFGADVWGDVVDTTVVPLVRDVLDHVASVVLHDVLGLWPEDLAVPPMAPPDVSAAVEAMAVHARAIGPHVADRLQQATTGMRHPSHRQLTEALREAFGYGEREARRIARTETAQVINGATDEAMRPAADAGIVKRREWLATSDARTRPTHASADAQRRGMEEPFHVGGAELMYPGDPAGPAREVVNCRCAVLYLVE